MIGKKTLLIQSLEHQKVLFSTKKTCLRHDTYVTLRLLVPHNQYLQVAGCYVNPCVVENSDNMCPLSIHTLFF